MDPKILRRIIAGIGILFMFMSWIILLDYSHYHCSMDVTDESDQCQAENQMLCVEGDISAWHFDVNGGTFACPYHTGSVVIGAFSLFGSMIFLGLYVYFTKLSLKTIIAGAVGELFLFIGMILMFVDVQRGADKAVGSYYEFGNQGIFIVGALFALFGFLDVAVALFMAWKTSKEDQSGGEYTSAGFSAE